MNEYKYLCAQASGEEIELSIADGNGMGKFIKTGLSSPRGLDASARLGIKEELIGVRGRLRW